MPAPPGQGSLPPDSAVLRLVEKRRPNLERYTAQGDARCRAVSAASVRFFVIVLPPVGRFCRHEDSPFLTSVPGPAAIDLFFVTVTSRRGRWRQRQRRELL